MNRTEDHEMGSVILDYPGDQDLITWVLKSEYFLTVVMGKCDHESKVRDADGGRESHVKECG